MDFSVFAKTEIPLCRERGQEKASFLRRPCDHDRVLYVKFLLSSRRVVRPWIRRFTTIVFAWWLKQAANKYSIGELPQMEPFQSSLAFWCSENN